MKRDRHMKTIMLAVMGFLGSIGVGILSLWLWPADRQPIDIQPLMAAAQADSEKPRMALCSDGRRISCIVDGDTIWLNGEKIRIADIDTPEVSSPQCDYEYQLGMQATYRLRDLLNEGPWSVKSIGSRDTDQYGRKLRVLTRNGQSIGDMLVREGMARTWNGKREPWC